VPVPTVQQVLVPTIEQLLSFRASKIKALRFVPPEEWWILPRPVRKGPFWTELQHVFYDAICSEPIKCCAHCRLTIEGLAKAAGATEEEIKGHLSYMPELFDLLTGSHRYVPEWVKVFFASLWIPRDREFIEFIFAGDHHQLTRQQIAEALGVPLVERKVQELRYPLAEPPRRVLAGGTEPPVEMVSIIFRQPFSAFRRPEELTQLSAALLLAFKKSLYPRAGFGKAITVMQQWLLALMLGHIEFDIVDLLICEWEDWITNGFMGKRRMP
jgi:hypothetical protein